MLSLSLLTVSHPPSPLPLFLSDVCTRKKTKSVALSFLPHYFVISQSNNFAFPQREIHGTVLHMPGHAEQKEKRKRITEGRRVDMYRGCRSERSGRKRAFRDGRGGSQMITVTKEMSAAWNEAERKLRLCHTVMYICFFSCLFCTLGVCELFNTQLGTIGTVCVHINKQFPLFVHTN